jgi:hypothetical protein
MYIARFMEEDGKMGDKIMDPAQNLQIHGGGESRRPSFGARISMDQIPR